MENTGGEGTVCWENRREMWEKIGSSFVRNLVEIVGDRKVEGDMVSRAFQKNPNVCNQLARWLFPFWAPRRITGQKIGTLGPFLRCSLEIGIFRS